MCKKLIFVLAMLAMVVPASAIVRGVDTPGADDDYIVLKLDINDPDTDPPKIQSGWTDWTMSGHWGPIGKQTKLTMSELGDPIKVTLDAYTWSDGLGQLGGARDRIAAGPDNTSDFGLMYPDLTYVPQTAPGLGQDYMILEVTMGTAYAGYSAQITTFCWDPALDWASEQPGTKWMAWSTSNPGDYLDGIGEPNGYGYNPTVEPYESNMPAGLMDLVGEYGYALQQGRHTWLSEFDDADGMTYAATVEVTLDENGVATIYGWQDGWTETGSHHLALNGIVISLPEPATIALLGLGGLALIRRKR